MVNKLWYKEYSGCITYRKFLKELINKYATNLSLHKITTLLLFVNICFKQIVLLILLSAVLAGKLNGCIQNINLFHRMD